MDFNHIEINNFNKMSAPPPLHLSWPEGHPGAMPYEPWPCGRHCSSYGGTPLLPGSEASEEEYNRDKRSWAEEMVNYIVKLQKWIDENTENQDPKVQTRALRDTNMIPHYRERIAPYLRM